MPFKPDAIPESEKNLNEEDMIGTHFFAREIYEREKTELQIDGKKIIENFDEAFAEIQNKSRLVFLGLNHGSVVSHEKCADLLDKIEDAKNTVLAVEYPPDIQSSIDMYLSSGRFRETDNSELYNEIYDCLRKNKIIEIPEELRGTIFDDMPEFIDVLPLLVSAKKQGLRVVAFDKHFRDMDKIEPNQRDEGMMQELSQIDANAKIICVCGGNHAQYGEYAEDGISNVSLANLAKQLWGEKVTSFYLENHADYQKYAFKDQQASSVLFEAMKDKVKDKSSKNVMLKVDQQTFPKNPKLAEVIASDYYVSVGIQ